MFLLIFLTTAVLLANGDLAHDDNCYDKFEYVFKIMARISEIEKKLELQEAERNQCGSNCTTKLEKDILRIKRKLRDVSATYTRWGKSSCPNGTSLVYDGFAAGSFYQKPGAAANLICLSKSPTWNDLTPKPNVNLIWGAEYETTGTIWSNLHDVNVPCAVCNVPHSSVVMMFGRNDCINGFSLEYSGYLMSGYETHAAATEFVCVDDEPEGIPNSNANTNGKLFYFVQANCGSLGCPPYKDKMKVTCAVCSFSP